MSSPALQPSRRVLALIASFLPAAAFAQSATQSAWNYPQAHTVEQVDEYHGLKVSDPYRWLENPDAEDSRAWIDAENALTHSYLAGVTQRDAIHARITKLWDFEKYGTPFKEGGVYFYSYNAGLQNQAVIHVASALAGQSRVLLDPNTLKADGTMALAGLAVSEDGKRLAYGIAEAGSDWNTWKVRDVATGADTEDVLNWVKFSGASWTKDSRGFFYSRFDEPKDGAALRSENYYQKVFYHALGTPQSQDILVYHEPAEAKKDWGFGGSVTDDGTYLVINVSKGTDPKNRLYYKPLNASKTDLAALGDLKVVKLLDDFDASYDFVGNDGGVFYFKTDLNAPRARVIAIDTAKPERANWKELIPQSDATLQSVGLVGDLFHCIYLRDAKSEVKVYDLAGKHVRDVQLPGIGTVGGFGGKQHETETFYSFASFTAPTQTFRYDTKTGLSTLFKAAKVDFNPEGYETKQVFYNSKDGTRVPMFIVHKKGVKLDGTNPTLLYGYGGFNISITPSFSVTNLVWMEMGGVYAVANIRGGGEYGEDWHQAGTKTHKQNVFNDFIAAGEWLIANKYTSSKKLAIRGGSNGGLLVGACMTQRPDLFGACLPEVGVLDMLRFHKFTIGHAWRSDYGSADGDESTPEQFQALVAYSPLHNVKPNTCYPPTMVMTADHDDRVVPAHSFKFAATVQAAQAKDCPNPLLIRIETRAGHGAGKPTAKIIDEAADRWAFLVRALGMQPTLAATPDVKATSLRATKANMIHLAITGMKCEACVAAVNGRLIDVPGVKAVAVSLEKKSADVTLDDAKPASEDDVINALKDSEFSATVAKN